MKHDSSQPEPTSCCANHAETTTPPCTCTCKTCRKPRYWLWFLGFALFYVLSVIPVGVGLYAFKSKAGVDLIKHGGYHDLLRCFDLATKRKF